MTACSPEYVLEYHRQRNPGGPYAAEHCASPAETGVGRWDCPPQRVAQLRREARALVRKARAYLAQDCTGPGDCPALIREAFRRQGVGWRADEAVTVATCESGLRPTATNGSHDGLFQQARSYWAGRAATYGMAGRSVYDPWANAWVSAGMVRETGWSHWSCQP